MQNNPLSSLGMQDAIWKLYRTDDPYLYEKRIEIPYMRRFCYETIHDGRTATLGLYKYNGTEIFKAWGYKDSEHCSYHAIKTNGTWSEVIEGCPDFKVLEKGFSLSHEKVHIWENGNYREEDLSQESTTVGFGICSVTDKEPIGTSFFEKLRTYTPLIFAALFSFAVGGLLSSFSVFTFEMFLMNAMGVFITILGLLKLKDVKKFASMFVQYDPIAKRFPLYAGFYPYMETGVGLLILSNFFVIAAQIAVILIYTLTTIGIISTLKTNKKLECGCLGGDIKLPLSKVTVFENGAMVAMAVYTIYTHF